MLLLLLKLLYLICCLHIISIAGKIERGSFCWAPFRLAVFFFGSIAEYLVAPSSSGIETSQDRVWSSGMGEVAALVEVKCALRSRTEVSILSVRDVTAIIVPAGKDHAVLPLVTLPARRLLVYQKSSRVQIDLFLDASGHSDTVALVNVEGGPAGLCLDA